MQMRIAILLSVAFIAFSSAPAVAASDARPNILLCLADDWAWPHAGVYGDPVVRTPAFDRIAREGALFRNAHTAAPSCTPSRAAILTGQAPHRLSEGGNLHGFLPSRFGVYPDLLEAAGYAVGFTGKGWGPGRFQEGGRTRNPAGPNFPSFENFLKQVPPGRPFCFWFGSNDPHRPYDKGSGAKAGLDAAKVRVPPYLPDTPEVRSDILDYYYEVERFDKDLAKILSALEAAGRLNNTLIVVTGDNGWPFPRSKANLYDSGTHQPFALRWPQRIKAGRTLDDYISLTDLAPTFLDAAGIKPSSDMTGRSLLGLAAGAEQPGRRPQVFVERERHANVRSGNLSYPSRAIRTRDVLYIRNFRPERWPAGDPELWFAVGPFGDCDGSPTKNWILNRRSEDGMNRIFRIGFEKRPAEELYDLRRDPYEIDNVAGKPAYTAALKKLRAELERWMRETADPRAASDADPWDSYPYYGERAKPQKQ